MTTRALATLMVALLLCLWPSGARAQIAAVDAGLDRIDERIESVGRWSRAVLRDNPLLGPVSDRIRISGSVLGASFEAGPGAPVADGSQLFDARVFVDADLLEDFSLGGVPIAGSVGVSFEWEFRRLGRRVDDLGELFLDVRGLGGSPWWNLQVGRFQIPVGEAYLRFGKAVRENPFITNPVSGTWWWDEGIRLHGSDEANRFGYVASISEGGTPRDFHPHLGQATLKLFARPTSWAHLSASMLWSDAFGSNDEPGQGALWLGESWARSPGSGSPLPLFIAGQVASPASGRIGRTLYFGVDTVLRHERGARLWLSYGTYDIDAERGHRYGRRLHGWLAEVIVEGRLLSPAARRFQLALRASGLGTYDGSEGSFLDIRYLWRLGYNARSLETLSAALAWRLSDHATLRVEYTHQEIDLVDGASAALPSLGRASFLGTAIGLHF